MDMSTPKFHRLADKAMLVKLTIRRASLTRKDEQLTNHLQAQENDASLTVLTKMFRDKQSPIYQIMQEINSLYGYHKERTLPWIDAGPRLLPGTQYFEYTQEMRGRIARIDRLLDQWMPQYDVLVDNDILYRNGGQQTGRASRADYPTAHEFRQRMTFDLRFQPMPDQTHFLFDLDDDDKRAFDDALEQAAKLAKADAINRMLEPLHHLVKKLETPIDKDGAIFRDSAIENIVAGCQAARKLTLEDNPEMTAQIDELERLALGYQFAPSALREVPSSREAAAKKLADIADKMGAFFN